ncbi:MAG: type II toxin-antitoxin system RelE/ParE family toxin [Phycisphaeraceae bacterium]
MASDVKYRRRATEDLELIWRHIARDSQTYATAVAARIFSAIEDLAEYPRLGHRVQQIDRADVRELPVYPYRVFNIVELDTV